MPSGRAVLDVDGQHGDAVMGFRECRRVSERAVVTVKGDVAKSGAAAQRGEKQPAGLMIDDRRAVARMFRYRGEQGKLVKDGGIHMPCSGILATGELPPDGGCQDRSRDVARGEMIEEPRRGMQPVGNRDVT
jgi:hypothetical protein